MPSWGEVLDFSDGFFVEARVPHTKNGLLWRGLLKKMGDSFFFDLRLYEGKGKEERPLRSFTYLPPQVPTEPYISFKSGGLEYRDYEQGYLLLIPIPPPETPAQT